MGRCDVVTTASTPTTLSADTAGTSPYETIMSFFCNRLLLKRYRKDVREETPEEVERCEKEFSSIAKRAVSAVGNGETLDALEWVDLCSDFSERWLEVSHWVSPKKLRDFLTEKIGAKWTNVEQVPAHKELPPVDLKWYKNPEGCQPVQPCVCPLCNVVCNSFAQFKAHTQGRTHRALVKAHFKKGYEVDPLPYTGQMGAPTATQTSPQEVPSQWSDSTQQWAEMPPYYPATPYSTSPHYGSYEYPPYPAMEEYPTQSSWPVYSSSCNSSSTPPESSFEEQECSSVTSDVDSAAESSKTVSILDTAVPVPKASDEVLSPELQSALERLTNVITQLQSHPSEHSLQRAQQLVADMADSLDSLELMEGVGHMVIDAAVSSEDPSLLADFCVTLCNTNPYFSDWLNSRTFELAGSGFGGTNPGVESASVRTYLSYVYYYHYSSTFSDMMDTRARYRYRGLIRFVAALLQRDVVTGSILLRCVDRICDSDAESEDVASLVSVLDGLWGDLPSAIRRPAVVLLKKLIGEKWMPSRVKHQLAPLLTRV